MILESHLHNEGVTFNFEPFKFDGWQNKPSRFLIDFVCEDVEYEYAFELTRERIISESLYHYPVGRRAMVFGAYSAQSKALLGDYRSSESIGRTGNPGDTNRENDTIGVRS